jgi:phosphoribosyl-ATP pyrophosphohydrolase
MNPLVQMILRTLKRQHQEVAAAAGNHPANKVAEECCEVILAHQEGESSDRVEEEEWDLLMSLVAKHMQNGEGMKKWKDKLDARGRQMVPEQQEFYDFFTDFKT